MREWSLKKGYRTDIPLYFSNIKRPEDINFEDFMVCQSPANAQLLARFMNSLSYRMN